MLKGMKILKWMFLPYLVLLLANTIFNMPVFCAVNPQAYVNRTYGFSINPPSGWSVDESGAFGSVVIFYGPIMPETGSRVNILISAGTTNLTLEQFVSAGKSQLASLLTDYHLVSEDGRNIGGLDGYELVITWTYMPVANVSNTHAVNVKQKQVLFVEKGRAYILTFTASPTNYEDYLPAFEESLQTFKLLGEEPPWLFIGFLIGGIIVIGIICSAATLHVIQGKRIKVQQQKIEREMLDVLKLHKSIKIEDLAKRLETKEADIELAVVRLRKNGVTINFNRETREVIYEKQE